METAPGARQAVFWKGSAARGLLIDTPALPLRFEEDDMAIEPQAAPAATLQSQLDDAQQRIRQLESLLMLRGLPTNAVR
jgi:hypothetical protein